MKNLKAYIKLFVGVCIFTTPFSLTARTNDDGSGGTCGLSLSDETRQSHGGYSERMTRTILIEAQHQRLTYRLEVDHEESVARFRTRLGDILRTSRFKIMYGDIEVLSDVRATVGNGADYLLDGNILHRVVCEE